MKRIIKFVLLLILVIWLGLEGFNFYEYRRHVEASIRAPIGLITYRPLIFSIGLQVYRNIFNIPVDRERGMSYKPVIYLYPTSTERVDIQLDYKGEIVFDYPAYNSSIKGWSVIASPDGKIINNEDGKEYSYLFWEGIPKEKINYDMRKGFVVRGEDTRVFLQNTLSKMGLTPKEYNEFIVYWYPKMVVNKYNLIHFAGTEYTETAPLVVTPKPDSVLRVFMVYKPINYIISIEPQEIKGFKREGFTVIEWGGTNLKK